MTNLIGVWGGRVPLDEPYGEAVQFLQTTAAVSREMPEVHWLLTGHENDRELRALRKSGIPTLAPRLPWPPRRVVAKLRRPSIRWQYPGLSMVHYWTSKAAPPPGLPYVLTILDGMALGGRFGERLDPEAARQLASGAEVVTTVRMEGADLIRNVLGLPDLSLVPLGAGVDDRFRPDGGPGDAATLARHHLTSGYLLYVGGWAQRKGLDVLAEALGATTSGRRPQVALTGDPGAQHHVLADRLRGVGARLLGYVTDEDLPVLIRGADAVVLPTLGEGFGLPVIEAQASGTPVIASDLPVTRSVSGGHAVFVPPGDAQALAQAMSAAPGLRNRFAREGILNAQLHRWADSGVRLRAVYEEVLHPRPAG